MSERLDRFTHCTHPTQAWCDCDWCRLVRADEKQRKAKNARQRASYQARRDLGLVKTPSGWE